MGKKLLLLGIEAFEILPARLGGMPMAFSLGSHPLEKAIAYPIAIPLSLPYTKAVLMQKRPLVVKVGKFPPKAKQKEKT